MRRAAAVIACGVGVGCIAPAGAWAQPEPVVDPVPVLSPSATAPSTQVQPAPAVEAFGWQVVAADALGMVTSLALAAAVHGDWVVVPYLAAAPAVHVGNGDPKGAIASLLLHAAAPIAGAYIGYEIDA